MKKIEAIIFDMDGLLFDTEKIGFKVWRETCSKYGYNMDKKLFFSIISRNANEIREILTREFGEKFDFDLCYKEKNQLANEEIDNIGVPIKKGAKELLDYLIKENYKIALATSSRRERVNKLLNKSQLIDKFSCVICGDEVEYSKPNPDIFLKVAKKINIDCEKCLVLEDSKAGVIAANRANMNVINVPDLKEPDEEVKKISLKIFSDLIQVKEFLESI